MRVSLSGSCPTDRATSAATSPVVTASMSHGRRAVHGATGRTAVEVMPPASPRGVRFALRTRKRDETGRNRPIVTDMGLDIRLLGPPRVDRDGAAVTFETRKATALLAHLALSDRPRSREALCELLYPGHDHE